LDKIVCFAMSEFGGTHAAFRLMITCAVRRYGFLLRTLPPDICRPYLAIADRTVRTTVYRIVLGVSRDVQTLYQLNCAMLKPCAVRRYGFLLRTLPPDICRPYLATAHRTVRTTVYRIILGVSQDVQTLDQLNCAMLKLSLPAEFGGFNVPSLELDAEPSHYASFNATLANLISDYESESLGPLYGLIRQELLNVDTSTLP
jgi:hypothetical protein